MPIYKPQKNKAMTLILKYQIDSQNQQVAVKSITLYCLLNMCVPLDG